MRSHAKAIDRTFFRSSALLVGNPKAFCMHQMLDQADRAFALFHIFRSITYHVLLDRNVCLVMVL